MFLLHQKPFGENDTHVFDQLPGGDLEFHESVRRKQSLGDRQDHFGNQPRLHVASDRSLRLGTGHAILETAEDLLPPEDLHLVPQLRCVAREIRQKRSGHAVEFATYQHHVVGERVESAGAGGIVEARELVLDTGQFPPHDRPHQLLLAPELLVDGLLAHPHRRGDLVGGHPAEAHGEKKRFDLVQDPVSSFVFHHWIRYTNERGFGSIGNSISFHSFHRIGTGWSPNTKKLAAVKVYS